MGLFDMMLPIQTQGRKRKYNRDRCMAVIFGRLSTSSRSLQSICRARYMPAIGTVAGWIRDDPALAKRYTECQRMQVDNMAREIVEIADNRKDNPLAVRNSVDARKWIASKLAPERYGDKLDISGTVTVQTDATSLQAALRMAYILAQLQERQAAAIDVTPTKLID